MIHLALLTFILGATVPAYSHANAAASPAADVKTVAAANAEIKIAAARQQEKVPGDIIPESWTGIHSTQTITQTDCAKIISWLQQDPEKRKDAQRDYRMLIRPILWILVDLRFARHASTIQPALDFLLSLKPTTHSAPPQQKRSENGVYASSSLGFLAFASDIDPYDAQRHCSDFLKFIRRMTRLMFTNSRNLLWIKEDATYLKNSLISQHTDPFSVYLNGGTDAGTIDDAAVLQNRSLETVLHEVETIRNESVARLTLTNLYPSFQQVFPPELRNIMAEYVTELTAAEANRAVTELA